MLKNVKKPVVGKKNLTAASPPKILKIVAPPKILKNNIVFVGSVVMKIEQEQKFLPDFCSRAKMRAKINFTPKNRAKMDTSRLGYICII